MTEDNTIKRGSEAEQLACNYLEKHALKLVTKNFRAKYGEIDLIMKDKEHLVFVEVRLRNNQDYGTGADTVTPHKQRKLRNTANFYLQTHYGNNFPPCRFDVISMSNQTDNPQFDWIKNAF